MKLPSRFDLVKPDRTVTVVAVVTAVVTVLAVQLVLVVTSREQEHMDRFGQATAAALAELAVEPLMRQDRMHLGVIGNRLAEAPEIGGVASYSSDNRLLATTGELTGPLYTAPVTIEDSIVGYVRLTLHRPAFAQDGVSRVAALVLVAVLVPALVALGWSLARAGRRGELASLVPGLPAWMRHAPKPVPQDGGEPEPEATPSEPLPEIRHYLLAVNLYNQLSLETSEREFERSLCLELAEAVAEIYQGQVATLPGRGILLDFDHTGDDDRPFEVLCAAFVLGRLLHDESPFGYYRLGLNMTLRPADEALPLDDPAVADASLLSALARGGSLAVSAPFMQALHDQHRCVTRPLVNPLLDELTTSGAGCHLITELQAPFTALVVQQAEQLKSQRDTISSPSTF